MEIPRTYDPKPQISSRPTDTDVFPTDADCKLRDALAGAFLSAHRGWNGNRPGNPMVQNPADAEALATIAVIMFRKSQL